jgi:hypothetical protein
VKERLEKEEQKRRQEEAEEQKRTENAKVCGLSFVSFHS